MPSPALWVLLLAFSTSAFSSQQMPRFNYRPSNVVLLAWDDVWHVGASNALSILTEGKKLYVSIAIGGNFGGGLKMILKYKCPGNSDFQSIDLSSGAISSEQRCLSSIPFNIEPDNSKNRFQLKMGRSKILFVETLQRHVTIVVSVEWSTGSMESNPLFLFNFDPLSELNVESKLGSKTINQHFLTSEAIKLVTKLSNYQNVSFPSVDFIDSSISTVIKTGPSFLLAKLNIGTILYFDAGPCLENYQIGSAVVFANYRSKLDDRHRELLKLMRLDISNGKLTFAACGLNKAVENFYREKRPSSFGICTLAMVSGEAEPYSKTASVHQRLDLSELKYADCASISRKCEVVPDVNGAVTIVTGMDTTALVCPIICDDKSQPYRFFRDGVALYPDSNEWTEVDGLRISRTGNIIEFTSTVSGLHSGIYKCEVGSKTFNFNVTVISPPHFAASPTQRNHGLLPAKIFAMEGESLSYKCIATFSGVTSTTISPVFYMVTRGQWEKQSEESFRQKVLTADSQMSISTSKNSARKNLTVNVASVPQANTALRTNFSHRFECDASLDPDESQRFLGMSLGYRSQTGVDVFFIPRLTAENFKIEPRNNCSVQKCGVKTGANFVFSPTEQTVAYLKAIGVEVFAYFRLDEILLEDVKILFEEEASLIAFNKSSLTLSYQIKKIRSKDVLEELMQRKKLTAVYNLRYPSGTSMANLHHNKTIYVLPSPATPPLDCRSDPLCFYSTEFDLASGKLDFLSVDLGFEVALLPTTGGVMSAGTLVGIFIAAAVALIVGMVAAYMLTRSPEHAYQVEEKEIRLGHNPRAEAKEEIFKDYVRAGGADQDGANAVVSTKRSLASNVSINSKDDLELS